MRNLEWLRWAQRMQAIAQAGLAYSRDPYDLERFQELRELAVEMAAAHTMKPVHEVAASFAKDRGYPTPKVDIRAVVFDGDGRLLLVRERQDRLWSLPGGWADIGTSPGDMTVREVREESGYEVRASKLLAVFDRARHPHPPMLTHIYKLFIRCDLLGGDAKPGLETEAVGFFSRRELPPLSMPRVTESQIQRMFEHYDHPAWPTDFD